MCFKTLFLKCAYKKLFLKILSYLDMIEKN